jgi:hypothetical protein
VKPHHPERGGFQAQLSHHCGSDALKMAEFCGSDFELINCGAKSVRLLKRIS